jgi:predicted dehydrogenase
MQKVRWGILGVARIATVKVIPAMLRSGIAEISAISSRDPAKAEAAAEELGIPKAYGSYEEMLADPGIDAVYNPLPNHMHVAYSILAAEAGKHVLCEKPLGMDAAEVRQLIVARDRCGVVMGEAFMVRTHPQWVRTIELVREGRIGRLRSAVGHFGFMNVDPANTRNIREYGGGALYDIGCYPIKTSRMVFGEEPLRVAATLTRDPAFDTDILTSAVLEYPSGHCVFSVSTQTLGNQSMKFFGTTGRIEIPIPFNPPSMETSVIRVNDDTEEFAACDQYTIQGDAFSLAIRNGGAPPVPLEDSLRNMMVIDAVFRAAESGKWESVEPSVSATRA